MAVSIAAPSQHRFLGHPIQLVPLFLSEMWERFSFYGMRALLILYMVDHLKFADADAFDVLGSYLALVYALPMLGGIMADRVLGHRNAVMVGQVLMALGHITLTFDGGAMPGPETQQVLYTGLALVAVGNGFMKPNISTLVGKLYEEGDPRRDAGFSIFYMGINIGAAAASIACAQLAAAYGWRWGFGAAGLGMLIGLAVFSASRASLPEESLPAQRRPSLPLWLWPLILVLLAATWGLLQAHVLTGFLLAASGALVVAYLGYQMAARASDVERGRMVAALLLTAASIVLWFVSEQAAGSLTLLADRHVPRVFLGYDIAAASYQSLNPIFIIGFAPVLGQLSLALGERGRDLSTPAKFALGLALTGASMAVLWLPCQLAGAGMQQISPWWLVLSYLLGAIGELLISPIGLSAITRLAMPGMVGTMMGLWFLGSSAGEFLAQEAGKLVSIDPSTGNGESHLGDYITLFVALTAIGMISAAVIFLARSWLDRLIAEPERRD